MSSGILKPTPDINVRPFVIISLAAHIAFVLFMTLKTALFPGESIKYIPSIRVDIVALPDKKPMPKAVAETKKAPVTPKVVIKKSGATEKVVLKKDNTQKKAIDRIKSIEKIEEMLKKETTTVAAAPKVVKGNRISPGSAIKGLNKLEYNNYLDQVYQHARSAWALPKWLANTDLTAEARILFDERGYVIKREVTRSSGDPTFDQSVLQAIDKASPFPAPEDKFVDVMATNGIIFNFKK